MGTTVLDISSIAIVAIFLLLLLAVRQVIVSNAGALRKRLVPSSAFIHLRETQRIDRTTRLSLLELNGQPVAVLHGPGKVAFLLLPQTDKVNDE